MPRSHRPVRTHDRSSSTGQEDGLQAGGPGNQAASKGQGGGILGWFRDAGDWVGDQVSGATEAVGEWASDTKAWAQDAWEAGTSTDIGMENGTVYLETDLDELSDLMSAETRKALALDRATAENRVRIAYNYDTGELTATSDEIALAGFHTEKVSAAQVLLRNIKAVFIDQARGESRIAGAFSLLQYKKAMKNLQAVVTIGSAQATDVAFAGPAGPTSVASVALEGMTGTVGTSGGLPFSDSGTTDVDFALQHAVLEGLAAEGHTVASAELTGVSAGMSGSSESAFLEAEALAVAGVAGESRAGDATVRGLRVDVDNKGGGLLGVDGKADRAKARVAVEAASVTDLDTTAIDARALSAGRLQGSFDSTSGLGSASVGRLQAEGLDTSWVDANRIEAQSLSIDGDLAGRDGRRNADLDVKRLTGDGVSVVPTTDGNTAAAGGGKALDWSANLDTIDLKDTHAAGTNIASTVMEGTRVTGSMDGDASTLRAEVADAALTGFQNDTLRADSLTTRNTTMTAGANQMTAMADHVHGTGIQTDALRAGELHAYGGTATMGHGAASASFDRARLEDATVANRFDVASAEVDHFAASRGGGRSAASFGTASATGLRDRKTDSRVASGALEGAAIEHNESTGTVRGHLDKGSVTGASGMGGSLDSASIRTVDLQHGTSGSSVTAASATVSGLSRGESRLDAATVDGISAERKGSTDTLGVDQVALSGLAHGDHSAASASANGLSATRDERGMRGGIDTLSAQELKVGDTASAASAHAHGLALSKTDSGLQASVTEAALLDSKFQTAAASGSLSSAVIKAGAISQTDGGITGGAGSVRLKGLDARGRMGGGSGGSSGGGFDTARAIETTAANIQDAEVSAGLNLKGGKLGVAGLKAKPDTRVDASVSIRDGKVQDQGTGVDLSKPVSGPLWTALRGGYMEEGKLKADIRGWADMDVTDKVNGELGVSGDTIPDVATIGAGVASELRSKDPSSSTDPSTLRQQLDMQSLQVDAHAQLGSGVIDTGSARVDLGRAQQAGDNRLDVSARDGSLEAEIQRFLADSTRYASGGTSASTGATSATGVDLNASEAAWSMQVDELHAHDVRGSKK